MTSRVFCGIDPGLSGAIGFIDEAGRFLAVVDMPVLIATTGRKQVDPIALAAILREYDIERVLVERVGPRPGEGPTGAFGFGHTFGAILGVLGALGVSHDLIQPATWKRRAGIPPGSDKGVSIATCKRLLPDAAPFLVRLRDDGRAEALLLALQARYGAVGTP